jgi:hypothetical protein
LGLTVTKPSAALKLSERPKGLYIDATEATLRLNPGESENVTLVATAFGAPKSGQTINLKFIPDPAGHLGKPEAALSFPASVTTGANGFATAKFTASDPANPRTFVDGQI